MLALAAAAHVMDLTLLHLAAPAISGDLQPSSAQLLWIIDIHGSLVAGSLITMGMLGDRSGRRRLLLFGVSAFGLASVLAVFSTSAEMLIATRALLGIAGATVAPSTLSLLQHVPRPPAAHDGHRSLDYQLLGRRRHRTPGGGVGVLRPGCGAAGGRAVTVLLLTLGGFLFLGRCPGLWGTS